MHSFMQDLERRAGGAASPRPAADGRKGADQETSDSRTPTKKYEPAGTSRVDDGGRAPIKRYEPRGAAGSASNGRGSDSRAAAQRVDGGDDSSPKMKDFGSFEEYLDALVSFEKGGSPARESRGAQGGAQGGAEGGRAQSGSQDRGRGGGSAGAASALR